MEGRVWKYSRKTAVCIPARGEEVDVSLSAAYPQPTTYTEASVHSLVPSFMEPLPSSDMLSNSHLLEKPVRREREQMHE